MGGGMGGLGSAPSANSLFPSFKCELPLSWTRMPAKSKSLPRGLVVILNPDFPWKPFVSHSEIWPLKLNGDQYFEAFLVYKRWILKLAPCAASIILRHHKPLNPQPSNLDSVQRGWITHN